MAEFSLNVQNTARSIVHSLALVCWTTVCDTVLTMGQPLVCRDTKNLFSVIRKNTMLFYSFQISSQNISSVIHTLMIKVIIINIMHWLKLFITNEVQGQRHTVNKMKGWNPYLMFPWRVRLSVHPCGPYKVLLGKVWTTSIIQFILMDKRYTCMDRCDKSPRERANWL